ncbi:hypothetical protein SERLA73DRAFT_145452, partial [Serpula lacrymans var. lacrymans S7.3]
MCQSQVTRPASPVKGVLDNSSASNVDNKGESVKNSKYKSSKLSDVKARKRKRKGDSTSILGGNVLLHITWI